MKHIYVLLVGVVAWVAGTSCSSFGPLSSPGRSELEDALTHLPYCSNDQTRRVNEIMTSGQVVGATVEELHQAINQKCWPLVVAFIGKTFPADGEHSELEKFATAPEVISGISSSDPRASVVEKLKATYYGTAMMSENETQLVKVVENLRVITPVDPEKEQREKCLAKFRENDPGYDRCKTPEELFQAACDLRRNLADNHTALRLEAKSAQRYGVVNAGQVYQSGQNIELDKVGIAGYAKLYRQKTGNKLNLSKCPKE